MSLMDPRDPSERVSMNTIQNAHEAYRAAREDLDKRLNMINRLVRSHDAREFRDRQNWGYTANLNHVIELLDNVVEFLGGEKEATT